MTLAQAISACRQENVLSEKTEHLSHVIRSYRNLIHPGRSVRLGETASEQGAIIARALVEIIVEEIAENKKYNYGYTAEQIITKLEQDSTAIAILGHLLKDTSEYEKERLLLSVIPRRYFDLMNLEDQSKDLLSALVACYRLAFNSVSTITKEKVTKNFIKIIKEESSNIVWRYAFFKGDDIQYLSPDDASLLKQHFLSILKAPITDKLLQSLEGIGAFLNNEEITKFTVPFINTIARYDNVYVEDEFYSADVIKIHFSLECEKMKSEQYVTVVNYLKMEYISDKSHGLDKLAEAEKTLYDAITFSDLEKEIASSAQDDQFLPDYPDDLS